MGKFQDEIDFAKEVIKEDGDNNVKWFVTGSVIKDAVPVTNEANDKPWLRRAIKPTDSDTDSIKPHIVDIVFLPLASSGSIFKSIGYEARSDIPSGSIMGLMATQEFTPKLKDYIVKSDGTKLDVVMCDPISPDSVDVVYIMAFK